jgi:hypothetical protein
LRLRYYDEMRHADDPEQIAATLIAEALERPV